MLTAAVPGSLLATMAVSVLPLIALVLVTLHAGNAASTGPELTGEPGDPDPIKLPVAGEL